MLIDERLVGDVTVLTLKGKMTSGHGSEMLKDTINTLVKRKIKSVLLDLEGMPYMDNVGIGELTRSYTTVSRNGGKLKLLRPTKKTYDLLSILKLVTVFEIFNSEEEAIRSFEKPSSGSGLL